MFLSLSLSVLSAPASAPVFLSLSLTFFTFLCYLLLHIYQILHLKYFFCPNSLLLLFLLLLVLDLQLFPFPTFALCSCYYVCVCSSFLSLSLLLQYNNGSFSFSSALFSASVHSPSTVQFLLLFPFPAIALCTLFDAFICF